MIRGQSITDSLINVLLNAPPRDVADYIVDDLVAICLHIPSAYKQVWFTQALIRIPGNVLTEEEKGSNLSYFV